MSETVSPKGREGGKGRGVDIFLERYRCVFRVDSDATIEACLAISPSTSLSNVIFPSPLSDRREIKSLISIRITNAIHDT